MAIQYESGTLVPSSSQKARDIRQAWASAFIGKTGWTIEDANYVNGTTERTVITNSAGFALMIYNSTTLTDTNIRLCFGQSYNSTTHILSNVAMGTSSTTTNAAGFNTATFNPTTIGDTPTGHALKGFVTTVNQTAWSAHIDDTYAVLSFKDGSTTSGKAVYFGEYDNLIENPAISNPYPFCMVLNSPSTVASLGVILNSPGNFNVNHSFAVVCDAITNIGQPANAGTADEYNINPTLVSVSPVFLVRAGLRPSTTTASTLGHLVGKLKPAVVYAAGGSWGDTVDLFTTGKPYMYVGGTSDSIYGYTSWWVETEEVI